jgi:hypothetical protein
MAVITCRHCSSKVNADAVRCPHCGADPRTGEGAVSDEEMLAAAQERARRAREGGARGPWDARHPQLARLPLVDDLAEAIGLFVLVAAALAGSVYAVLRLMGGGRRRRR